MFGTSMKEFKESMGFVQPTKMPESRIKKLQEAYTEFTTPRKQNTEVKAEVKFVKN